MGEFKHQALELREDKPLVYTALSKQLFYYRMFISKFVLEQGRVPLNPFMVFDYFLLDSIDRDLVREANNNLVQKSDQLWVFGPVSNGVLAEIKIAKGMGKIIRYFKVEKSHTIVECSKNNVDMEDEVAAYRKEL